MHTPLFRLPAHDAGTPHGLHAACDSAPPARSDRPASFALATAPGDGFAGWYDSSLDLRRGLIVTEHADARALAEVSALVAWRGSGR